MAVRYEAPTFSASPAGIDEYINYRRAENATPYLTTARNLINKLSSENNSTGSALKSLNGNKDAFTQLAVELGLRRMYGSLQSEEHPLEEEFKERLKTHRIDHEKLWPVLDEVATILPTASLRGAPL